MKTAQVEKCYFVSSSIYYLHGSNRQIDVGGSELQIETE